MSLLAVSAIPLRALPAPPELVECVCTEVVRDPGRLWVVLGFCCLSIPPYVSTLSRHASVPLPQEHWEEHAPAAVPPWFLPSNVNSLQGTL